MGLGTPSGCLEVPPQRLYATVYEPKDGDPAEFDEEAHSIWSAIFKSAGLDPSVHVVSGGKRIISG